MLKIHLETLRSRSRHLQIFLWGTVVFTAINAVLVGLEISLVERILADNSYSLGELIYNNINRKIVGWVMIGLFIGTAISFILWMIGHYEALTAVGRPPRFSRQATAWAFFVPILNLYRPYQIVKSYWEDWSALLSALDESPPKGKMILVTVWWIGAVLTFNLAGVPRYIFGGPSLEALLRIDRLELIGNLIGIPTALVAILMVTRIMSLCKAYYMAKAIAGISGVQDSLSDNLDSPA